MKIKETKTHKKVNVGDLVKIQVDESTTHYMVIVLLNEGYNLIALDGFTNTFNKCYDTIDEMMLYVKYVWEKVNVIKSENIELHIGG